MDVSGILASQASKYKSIAVEKDVPLEVDVGSLSATDLNPIEEEGYKIDLEEGLQNTARDGVQALISALFQLPTQSTADGPLAMLPPPKTLLPRAKPLPKPKPPTKWERFAAAKGIQKTKKDKKVWDEVRQEWVNRWGMRGKNKEKEEQWITEVRANADIDHDPVKAARDERKARVAKNEKQQVQNLGRAAGGTRSDRKQEIVKTLASSRISTASMGKFDKKLDGEKKLRGVKRKFDPTEEPGESEKKKSLALISKIDREGPSKQSRHNHAGKSDDVLNVRKAVRIASKGKGGVALGRELGGGNRPNVRGGRGGNSKRGGKR
ncbi:RRS1-domain-containing protein [Rickenella mellea]|uniref:Ribosome biogenesis regulatory protein n=1 Tax=Rickenella mellea TaxID=50990 RepID=A0A4R5XET8_9AGAM|nr:RRS1-domain-containing protein [Rickenella mellea]